MRDYFFKITWTQILASFLLAAVVAGCSESTTPTTTDPTIPPPTTPAGISLGTSVNWIPTDNSTAATLTALLTDSSNAVMPGIIVSFATTSGNLNASTATTDASGQATVTLKSGLADFSNRTATVTASVAGVAPASVPILIKGSTVVLTVAPSSTIQVGAGTLAATATATNAAGLGLSSQNIRFSIGAASTGAATLSAATLSTNAEGVTPALTFTPIAAGTVVLIAEWLDSAGAVTSTATKDIVVTPATGLAFAITTPSVDPLALSSGATQSLVATVPATIAGTAVANVRISATSGTWTGANPATGPLISILQTPTAGAVAATYTAPSNSGSMSVQVDALDASGNILGTLTRTFAISAPSSAAQFIFLSPSVSTIVPSAGGNISTSTLEVTVRDINLNAVGGAAVMFGLLGTTGSGESVSPAVAITDSYGKATTTFSAGTAPTLAAIYAQARVLTAPPLLPCTGTMPDPILTETNTLCDSAPLIVSAKAVSVTVGFGTKTEDAELSTQYRLPGSVLVVDANNSPVAGATVTLTAFPIAYRNGTITAVQDLSISGLTYVWQCGGPYDTRTKYWDVNLGRYEFNETSWAAAEDVNRNGILDAGEDTPGNGVLTTNTLGNFTSEDRDNDRIIDSTEDLNGNGILDSGEDTNANGIIDTISEDVNGNWILDVDNDVNGNGILDLGEDTIPSSTAKNRALAIANNGMLSPPQAAGGAVPLTVTTDSNGAATFHLQYPKSAAWFIIDEVMARVIVSGTESSAKTTLMLPMSVADQFDPVCAIGGIASY